MSWAPTLVGAKRGVEDAIYACNRYTLILCGN